jgi:hypothetical protein
MIHKQTYKQKNNVYTVLDGEKTSSGRSTRKIRESSVIFLGLAMRGSQKKVILE